MRLIWRGYSSLLVGFRGVIPAVNPALCCGPDSRRDSGRRRPKPTGILAVFPTNREGGIFTQLRASVLVNCDK